MRYTFRAFLNEKSNTINIRTFRQVLETALQKFIEKPTKVSAILSALKKQTGRYGIIYEIEKSSKVPANQIWIHAVYDPEQDEDDEPAVTVVLVHSGNQVTLDKNSANHMLSSISKAVAHEKIHQNQYRKRDWMDVEPVKSDDPQKSYYATKDEIEAFSHNIATEILDFTNNDMSKAKQLLRNITRTSTLRIRNGNLLSPDLFNYVKLFGANHAVTKRLSARIFHYLDAIHAE
jgi:hypothetical protein